MEYTIIYINDRAKDNIINTKNILSHLQYINDIPFCNGKQTDAGKLLIEMGFTINWQLYGGQTIAPIPTHLGLWVTNINIYKYIVKNKIKKMLVLEDDAILLEDFNYILNKVVLEAPDFFDFISLYSEDGQNQLDEKTDIGLKYIHKSSNQRSHFQGMIFSYSGAKKILRLLKEEGIQHTNDCQIFRKSLEGKLNGYSLKPYFKVIEHAPIKSTMDYPWFIDM